jgi:transcriptional regulator with XRE-family HTH domain
VLDVIYPYRYTISMKTLGARLRVLRTERGLSQAQLAARAKLSNSYTARVERGEQDPTVSVLVRLAKALGVSPAELLR